MAALAVCCALAALDQTWKKAPHQGFCPKDAACVAWAPDFAAAWNKFARSREAGAFEEIPQWTHAWELAVRNAAGIRPTPARCRTWFGPGVLGAIKDGQWGLCVHPGLLLRAGHVLHRLLGAKPEGECFRYGGFYYAWREGFLIFALSPDYVRESLTAPRCDRVKGNTAPDTLRIAWGGRLAGEAALRGGSPQIRGVILSPFQESGEKLALAEAWPERPALAISTPRWRDLRDLAGAICSSLGIARALEDRLSLYLQAARFGALEEDWDKEQTECCFALLGVETATALPIPEIALALRDPAVKAHPLLGILENGPASPYSWNDTPGWIMPVFGEAATLCLSGENPVWLAASREQSMDRLAGRMSQAGGSATALDVQLDCEQLGGILERLLRKAAEIELLPGTDSRSLDSDWIPLVRAIQRLAWFALSGDIEGGRLNFIGAFEDTEGPTL